MNTPSGASFWTRVIHGSRRFALEGTATRNTPGEVTIKCSGGIDGIAGAAGWRLLTAIPVTTLVSQ